MRNQTPQSKTDRMRLHLERLERRLMLDGALWYVDDVTDPAEDGSREHPFDCIQEGVDAAADGDEVVLLPGTYKAESNSNIRWPSLPAT